MIAPEPYEYALFGEKVCASCDVPLPANSDFFGVDRKKRTSLKSECRECLAKISRASYQRCREKHVASDRARRRREKVGT